MQLTSQISVNDGCIKMLVLRQNAITANNVWLGKADIIRVNLDLWMVSNRLTIIVLAPISL